MKMSKSEIIGFAPHPGQEDLINRVLEKFNDAVLNNSQKSHFVMNLGRSWGKTTAIVQLAFFLLVNYENQKLLYITPTFKLAKFIFRDIINEFENAPFIKDVNKTDLIITFMNGNQFKLGSAENPNSHRGDNTNTILVLDECAYQDESMWTDVMQPAMNVRGKLCLFISTPNGKNWFWDLFLKAKHGEPNWYYFEGKSEDSPYVNKQEIEFVKRTNPIKYRIEYCAEFLDDNYSVFQNVDDSMVDSHFFSVKIPDEKIHIGIDLGKKNDFSTCVAITNNYVVKDVLQIQNSNNWDIIIPQIANFCNKWQANHGFIEVNFNDRIYDELVREYDVKNLEKLFVEHTKKSQMVQNLQILFANVKDPDNRKKRITLPAKDKHNTNTIALYNELKAYQAIYNSSTGKTKWGAPRGMHDDCVSALLQACWSVTNHGGKSGSKSILWEPI
jgi:hypothetical protein